MELNIKIKQNLPDTATLEEVVGIADKITKAVDGKAEIEWGVIPRLSPKKSKNSGGKTVILKGPLKDLTKELAEMLKKDLKNKKK